VALPHFVRSGSTSTSDYQAEDGRSTSLVVLLKLGFAPFSDAVYAVEYRQGDGWDLGFVSSAPAVVRSQGGAVLVHQFRAAGSPAATMIETADGGAILQGKTLVLTSPLVPDYHVTVKSIDTINATATVSIGPGIG
jgi:hypothetical protein